MFGLQCSVRNWCREDDKKTYQLLPSQKQCDVESTMIGVVLATLLVAGITLWAMGNQHGKVPMQTAGRVMTTLGMCALGATIIYICLRTLKCVERNTY